MALRIQPVYTKIHPLPPKSLTHPFLSKISFSNKRLPRISCTNSVSDLQLASELAMKVAKINTHLLQREEAMEKSRELLFTEFCHYLALKSEVLKKKWRKMDEDEKWVLVKGFVTDWGANFHPLSARSVKEMVEEYVQEDDSSTKFSSLLFPGLKKIMGFSQNK
ncbi:Mediator of RNA polymerase II transcription subunit like [Quillaja saponaria]|uniref:Mediator of RNA polymerase II transcription subunit like n=1 Tax=Quillaja saponaria TaxID=32244 RepID=A0AAD7M1R3_QUISA|nr:Mediator of RNA polymerase II transcription subunit like [Quillaja saponaria]